MGEEPGGGGGLKGGEAKKQRSKEVKKKTSAKGAEDTEYAEKSGGEIPPLRGPTRQEAARKRKSGRSGRDDSEGNGVRVGPLGTQLQTT